MDQHTNLFRPCIDLHDGKVKQIVGGTLNTENGEKNLETNFVSEHTPAYYADMYRQDDLHGGHIIKLGANNDQAALEALHAWEGHLQIGGGITPENAGFFLDNGAAQVIVTSFVFSDGKFQEDNLQKLLKAVGKKHLVLDLSCRKLPNGEYVVMSDRWKNFTSLTVDPETLEKLSGSCAEFLIHAVDVEGKRSGIDFELLDLLCSYSPIPAVYAGGIAGFSDITAIENSGKGRIGYTIGSALDIFGGSISYREVVEHDKKHFLTI